MARQKSIRCSNGATSGQEEPRFAPMRYLDDLQEAIGILRTVDMRKNSLIVTMDTVPFVVDFSSVRQLESAYQTLKRYLGEKIAIVSFKDSTAPLRVRHVAPQGQNMAAGGQ